MFVLAGDTPEKAAREAAAVLEIETALARASTSRTALREPENRYHIYTVADFQKLTPDFDYSVYYKAMQVRPFDTLNVATPDFFKGLNELMTRPATCPRPSLTRTSPSSEKLWLGRRNPRRAGSSAAA
jgi:putative endopeptidase